MEKKLTRKMMTTMIPTCTKARVGETSHAKVPIKAVMAKLLTPASLCAHSRSRPISRPIAADAPTFSASNKVASIHYLTLPCRDPREVHQRRELPHGCH